MRRPVFVFLILLIALLCSSAPVGAQAKSLYWNRFDVDVTVQSNGDLRVVETQEITFLGGPFHFGYATIPGDRLDDITDIEIWEGGTRYQQSSSGQEYTFRSGWENGDLWVRWYFPSTSNSSHTFEFRYTVKGAVRRYEDGDEVWWMAVPGDHDYAIRRSQVAIRLPEGVAVNPKPDADGFVVDSDGVAADLSVSEDRRTVTAVAREALEPGDFLAVGVKFTPGVVGGSKPSWQADFDRRAEWDAGAKPVLDLFLGVLGLLALAGGPLGVYLLWYTRGRDPQVGIVADYLAEPPEDVPPGVVGTLLDEKADLQDVLATLIDLARRGYLTITEETEKGFAGLTMKQDFVFERTDKAWDDLKPYELTLLRKLFGGAQSSRMSDLKNKFYTALPNIRDGLYDAVVEAGYFRTPPDTTRRRFTILGVLVGALVLGAGIFATSLLVEWVSTIWCPAVGLLLGAVALIVVGQVMPAKTKKGAESAARWRAFRQYLKEIERYTDLDTAAELFERYLPYAIAFNLERRWVQKFARIEATPIPGWYFPYWMMGRAHGRGTYSGSGRGEGGARPSVQDMSDSLAGGLQSMSDGLVSMFNSVGKTFTSAPSSSGSGGGFSGGGFSGGGSSGGGSRGFG
jgi:uncharacterized membrane protein YgcG